MVTVAISSGGGANAAGTFAAARPWPASVPVPPQPNCGDQRGGTPLTPVSAQLLPGGGYAYNYVIDGVDNQYLVPPASFSPLRASAAQLAEYGFPAEPASASQRAAWHQAMAGYVSVPPPQPCMTGLRHGLRAGRRRIR